MEEEVWLASSCLLSVRGETDLILIEYFKALQIIMYLL